MESHQRRRVVIAGGGTAGWIAAAALSKKLGHLLHITLVESDAIGTVGVGEATIPPMRVFHKLLGIDEREFMAATGATFKLGIAFHNWRKPGEKYIHSFGQTGKGAWLADFHHFWLRAREQGVASDFGDYCYELQAAKENRFAVGGQPELNYAYHLDATRYATFLRRFSEALGVKRVEGKIEQVALHPDADGIQSLQLDSGECIEGDLFIDCTGFTGLLIEQALHTGYEDWSHWLPCDSAVVAQTASVGATVPYTRATARDAGWQWRINLQSRVGNGLVYCSRYWSDDEAKMHFMSDLDSSALNEPRCIKFRTGRRRKVWNKNCVALGLASGFVEPLESTSIHLIMTGVTRLMQLFPFGDSVAALRELYNQQTQSELEKIRDFIILHYHQTERDDTPFWRYCRNMEIPDTLAHRLRLFKESAHAFQADGELFRVDSWTQVMLGQGLIPDDYHPLARLMTDSELPQFLGSLSRSISQAVAKLPDHQSFIEDYCKEPQN